MHTLRKIFTLIFATTIICGSFVLFWYGPWSPNLEHRARTLILEDRLEEGVDLLLWRAKYAVTTEEKHKSLWDAARMVALKAHSMTWAKSMLQLCLQEDDFIYKADVHAQLATLLFEEQPRESIQHWEWAIYYGHDRKEAITWRIRLANALEGDGDVQRALDIWQEAVVFPESARMAHMALGRLLLKDDPSMSVYHFQRAKELAESERERSAELGLELAQFEAYGTINAK